MHGIGHRHAEAGDLDRAALVEADRVGDPLTPQPSRELDYRGDRCRVLRGERDRVTGVVAVAVGEQDRIAVLDDAAFGPGGVARDPRVDENAGARRRVDLKGTVTEPCDARHGRSLRGLGGSGSYPGGTSDAAAVRATSTNGCGAIPSHSTTAAATTTAAAATRVPGTLRGRVLVVAGV